MSTELRGPVRAQTTGGGSVPSPAEGKAAGRGSAVLQRYLERLHHSVRRGGLLYAFPTKSVKRLDLTRFQVAESSLPNDLLTKLIKSESGKIQFDLDISETNEQEDNPQRELFFA
ncbi:MAG TPA: hypothetical protein VGR14_00680, partial [Verrucomicrobiae bacterium]|nr:hypothetical protein [Verrucomicrobiae bacterium]